MALARRGGTRFSATIWPGFVDAMTALVLVLFFMLSVFMIVQFVLRDTISGQDRELDALSAQVQSLGDALGLARSQADAQEALIATLTDERSAAEARIAELARAREAAEGRIAELTEAGERAEARIASFEEQVASLIVRNQNLSGSLEAAREEISAGEEAARLAQARREALEALVADLRSETEQTAERIETAEAALGTARAELDEAEAARLAEAAAAERLRERLENSQAELTALTLSLEEERKRAEETLTLLAAAEAARDEIEAEAERRLTEAERRQAELAQSRALLAEEEEVSTEAQRQVALLNQQTAALRRQLASLRDLLETAEAEDVAAQVQLENLGQQLNAALARAAAEERARAELEARERERLAAEAQDLERYRSEFFGRMREILGEREGVEVVGDRFVFQSEVLFAPGSAVLGPEGRAQVSRVAEVIRDIADDVPPEIDWILRVDGHTDRTPLAPWAPFEDNWELSQARALSVVRYMIEEEGLPADRLAATGFGEHQPIDPGTDPESLARNRRIELKFTEA
jgi:chemotaxis protein MotB